MVKYVTFNHQYVGSNPTGLIMYLFGVIDSLSPYSSTVERDTVNIFISVQFTLGAAYVRFRLVHIIKRVGLIGKALCYGHKDYKLESYTRFH